MKPAAALVLGFAAILAAGCGGGSKSSAARTADEAAPPPPVSVAPAAPGQSVPPAPGSTQDTAAGTPQPAYVEIIKLYRANLSEDFILKRIREDGVVYDLGADAIIEMRSSGVSERVIEAMMATAHQTGAAAAAPDASPRRPPEDLARPAAAVTWEGVVRKNKKIVGNRWDIGALTFAEGQLRWIDARDAEKNLLIPERSISEQFLTCLKKPGGNECFEWGFRTTGDDEYLFRDALWEQGVNDKALAIHADMKARFPSLVDSQRPVDKK